MSDKSQGAEPEREEIVTGEAEAVDGVDPEAIEDDSLSIDDIDDPEALAEAEVAAFEDHNPPGAADDAAIAGLEEGFTDEERAAAAAPIVRKTAKAPVRKKDTSTRKRGAAATEHEDPYKAKNPAQFAQQSAGELRKVVWPTWPETASMFSAVLIFVLIMIAIVGGLDVLFGWGLLQLFGSK